MVPDLWKGNGLLPYAINAMMLECLSFSNNGAESGKSARGGSWTDKRTMDFQPGSTIPYLLLQLLCIGLRKSRRNTSLPKVNFCRSWHNP